MARDRKKGNRTALICRNVVVNGRRTSLRMEPLLWETLGDIVIREKMSINQICSQIDLRRGEANLTAALRVFIISYYRNAAFKTTTGFSEEPIGDFPQQESPLLRRALEEAIPFPDPTDS